MKTFSAFAAVVAIAAAMLAGFGAEEWARASFWTGLAVLNAGFAGWFHNE